MELLILGWMDYLVFIVLLGVSVLIGIYFAFFSKQDSVNEYLFAGKTMTFLPVAISGLSSLLSGVTFLGYPTEIYLHGSQSWMMIVTILIIILITNNIFLPVFFKLQLMCITEYLELRFSKSVRKICSISQFLTLIFYAAVVIYAPALVFAQTTGFDLHIFTPVLCLICIFYTSIGGVKTVIWTDTFQFFFIFIGLFSVLVIGIKNVGGLSNVFKTADEGNRLVIFNFTPSVYERWTIWSAGFFTIFSFLSGFSVSQKYVQKLLSIHEEKDARKCVWIILMGSAISKNVCILIGFTMYAKYYACDPFDANLIERADQLLPYFVMDTVGTIPGLPGIFLAGIISSSLATLSASLNTLGSLVYDDFVKNWLPKSYTKEPKAANVIKVIIVAVGLVAIGLTFVLENLGTIFELANSFGSIIAGPILGLFLLGMVLPWAGEKGALVGGYTSLAFMVWVIWGTKWHVLNQRIRNTHLPTSTKDCPYPLNETITEMTTLPPLKPEDEPLAIFRISFMYYPFIGTFITVAVGMITSYFVKEMDVSNVNPDHITPIMQRFVPKKKYLEVPLENHQSDEI